MKLSIKFFIWQLELKTKKLNSKEKIEIMLNELVKEIQVDGNMAVRKTDGFGSATIWIHNANTEKAVIEIEHINDWKYSTKPNFKVLTD